MSAIALPSYSLGYDDLIIYDCYKTHKCRMRPILRAIRRTALPGETQVFEHRSLFSMKMEWVCHKFLYRIGYERERTRDVDLDYPCDRPEWQYIVCGLLVWLFVW